MLVNEHKNCRVCSKETLPVLYLGDQCLDGLFNLKDFQAPERKVPSVLTWCPNCHLSQSLYSIDPDILYASYGYLSSLNSHMTSHLDKIVQDYVDIRKQFYLRSSPVNVLDIGSNDFYMLKQFPSEYRKVGIDPGEFTAPSNIEYIRDIFPSQRLEGKFDFISMVACFYDCNNPGETAQAIVNHLKGDGIVVVEVSYWPEKMKKGAFDEICREHVCFYSYENLESIFSNVGLKIFRAFKNDINGGSIQLWMARSSVASMCRRLEYEKEIVRIKLDEFDCALDDIRTYQKFDNRCKELRQSCIDLLKDLKTKGKTIHLYAASTKVSVLLSYYGITKDLIPYAAEKNSKKWGGRMLESDIEMISEEESRAMKPDYYFCSIWGFRKSVIEREKEFLERGGKFIFPIGENGLEVYPND